MGPRVPLPRGVSHRSAVRWKEVRAKGQSPPRPSSQISLPVAVKRSRHDIGTTLKGLARAVTAEWKSFCAHACYLHWNSGLEISSAANRSGSRWDFNLSRISAAASDAGSSPKILA